MRRVDLGDVSLAVDDRASGAPTLLLHGLGSSSADWDLVAPLLGARRLVIPDLRGHGQSSKPASGYGVPRMTVDVAKLLETLVREPAHVVGVSMGGMISLQLALDRPDLVRSVTVVNSGPEVKARTWRQRIAFAVRLVVVGLFGPAVFATMISRRLFPKPAQGTLRERVRRAIAANDRDAYRAATRALLGWTVTDRLGEIRCPVLVVGSDGDYAPLSEKHAYARRLAHARVVEIADSGHASPLDQPERVASAVREFLDEVEQPRVERSHAA